MRTLHCFNFKHACPQVFSSNWKVHVKKFNPLLFPIASAPGTHRATSGNVYQLKGLQNFTGKWVFEAVRLLKNILC